MVSWKQTSKLVKAVFATATSGKFPGVMQVYRRRRRFADLRFSLAQGPAGVL